jgi:hypothetical protein
MSFGFKELKLQISTGWAWAGVLKLKGLMQVIHNARYWYFETSSVSVACI